MSGWDILGYNRSRTDYGAFSNRNARKNRRTSPEPCFVPNAHRPNVFGIDLFRRSSLIRIEGVRGEVGYVAVCGN
jgi:hypothetical protein